MHSHTMVVVTALLALKKKSENNTRIVQWRRMGEKRQKWKVKWNRWNCYLFHVKQKKTENSKTVQKWEKARSNSVRSEKFIRSIFVSSCIWSISLHWIRMNFELLPNAKKKRTQVKCFTCEHKNCCSVVHHR